MSRFGQGRDSLAERSRNAASGGAELPKITERTAGHIRFHEVDLSCGAEERFYGAGEACLPSLSEHVENAADEDVDVAKFARERGRRGGPGGVQAPETEARDTGAGATGCGHGRG